MAPKLSESQHALISDMLQSGRSFKAHQIAEVARCTARSVYTKKSKIQQYGSSKVPYDVGGRPRDITSSMFNALCKHWVTHPHLYHDEMARFLLDEFDIPVSTQSIGRALRSIKWTNKKIRRVANRQNADLRDLYIYNTKDFSPEQFVFLDESGTDKRGGLRRTGWAPSGVTPVQIARFQREQRYQILPAYTLDGIIFSRIYTGHIDAAIFEEFVTLVLPHCNPFPSEHSVLVMDNASIHRSERIEQMCRDAGVILIYLPPYSPDLNPIEEFFAELKAFIKRHWKIYEDHPEQGFDSFLEWVLDVVGGNKSSARGHFRHSGLVVEEE